MYLLKINEIAEIEKDVENEGINFSHLKFELVDHICCEIESYMYKGISFSEAYEQVRMEFGIKGLRHIQQDTLMLIDKNYRIMKNSMKTIGVLALGLMAFGALFKIMHWPFSGIMLAISFTFIAVVFFPALLYVMYRDVNQKQQASTSFSIHCCLCLRFNLYCWCFIQNYALAFCPTALFPRFGLNCVCDDSSDNCH